MKPDELIARLTLIATNGLSGRAALRLFRACGSGVAALDTLPQLPDRSIAESAALPEVRERVARAFDSIQQQHIDVIGYDDDRYPERLRQRLDREAPFMLFALGDTSLLQRLGIAVVGTRRPTEYGLEIADQIGGGVVRGGAVVIGGLAVGIDAAAHNAALEADGDTIAINGCGVDVYYPHENVALQDRIATQGLLISEFLPGEPPLKHQFPHRNRVIAALSEAVVVVEAAARSGAVATANHAAKQGLDVYGVPNLLDAETFQGVRDLIRDGARTYVGVHSLLTDTGFLDMRAEPASERSTRAEPPVAERHTRVWSALRREAVHIDTIVASAGMPATDALVSLLELELDGRVRQLAGQRFVKVKLHP